MTSGSEDQLLRDVLSIFFVVKDYWRTKGTEVLNVVIETYAPPRNPFSKESMPMLPSFIKKHIPFNILNVIKLAEREFHIQVETPEPEVIAALFLDWSESCKKSLKKHGLLAELEV